MNILAWIEKVYSFQYEVILIFVTLSNSQRALFNRCCQKPIAIPIVMGFGVIYHQVEGIRHLMNTKMEFNGVNRINLARHPALLRLSCNFATSIEFRTAKQGLKAKT